MDEFVLGIDLGTSSIKIVLIDAEERIIAQVSELHNATISSDNSRFHEQNVAQIFGTLEKCLSALKSSLTRVAAIQVAGQMHGCVLWSSQRTSANGVYKLFSNHISWMDQRCTPEFLSSLPKNVVDRRLLLPDSDEISNFRGASAVHTGYGCATLFWLQRNGGISERFDRAGTIMDLIVSSLCNLCECVMSDQNAASWGYAVGTEWEIEILSAGHFPLHVLPKIVPSGTIAGRLKGDWLGIPVGTPVLCAIGDLQATAYPHLSSTKAMLNLGTSAQLCFVDNNNSNNRDELLPSVDSFPYFNNSRLLVAASLNGGNVVECFIKTLMQWSEQLTGRSSPSIEEVFSNVETLLMKDARCASAANNIKVVPTLFGERHDSTSTASINGLKGGSLPDLSHFLHKVIEGLVANLNSMLPRAVLDSHRITTIVLAGQAVKPWYLNAVRTIYGTDMTFESVSDDCVTAAYGAARFALHSISQ